MPSRFHFGALGVSGRVPGSYGTLLRKEGGCQSGYIIRQGNALAPYVELDLNPCDGNNSMGAGAYFTPDTVAGTGWHHLVATYSVDSGTLTSYVDGVENAQTPLNIDALLHTGDLFIGGAAAAGADGGFVGLMAEVRIYNRELGADEVQELYDLGESTLYNGIVADYPFNGDVLDYSENGNDGTLHGAVFQPFGFGSQLALGFDATMLDPSGYATTYVQVPESDSLEPSDSISISLWCDGVPGVVDLSYGTYLRKEDNCQSGYIIRTGGPGYTPAFQIDIDPCSGGGQDGYADFTSASEDGRGWHHLVATYSTDSGNMTSYLDGVQVGQAPFHSVLSHSGDLFIGGAAVGGLDGGFVGRMKNVRIYNYELAAPEVRELYTLQGTTLPITINIVPSSGNVILEWNTIPGRFYDVQYATSLSAANWQDLFTLNASTFTATISDTPAPHSKKYYRVALKP